VKKRTRKSYYRNDAFLQQIGLKIRELRLKKELTQMDLAYKCNDVDYSQINRVELGKVNFSVSFLILVAEALEISPEELLKF
jgi:transcriptional regulator with XRE-family HTH domain